MYNYNKTRGKATLSPKDVSADRIRFSCLTMIVWQVVYIGYRLNKSGYFRLKCVSYAVTTLSLQSHLFGPQFSLQASATTVSERPNMGSNKQQQQVWT